jgi:pimeloyl-ACP methyl ester carboxylesterase
MMPTINANGITLYYEERGTGDPLILIMGLGAPGSRWEDHVSYYASAFRCITIDNRGADQSDRPQGPYTTRMMAEDIAGLMRALDIEHAYIAGISMGSAIAQELALSYPNMVRSMVLISSWSQCDPYTQAIFYLFKNARAQMSPANFTQLLQLWIASPHYFETHLDSLIQGQKEAHENYMSLHAFEAQCDACLTHHTIDRLAQIEVPTLLTVGEADIFTPLRLTAEIHDRMPRSEMLVFPGKGHIHHWEELDRFNNATFEFLLSH